MENQSNIKDFEHMLQSQIDDESWIGVYPSGTMGELTYYNPNQSMPLSNRWKLLFEGNLAPEYEESLRKGEMGSSSKKSMEKEWFSDLLDPSAAACKNVMRETDGDNHGFPKVDISMLLKPFGRAPKPNDDGTAW